MQGKESYKLPFLSCFAVDGCDYDVRCLLRSLFGFIYRRLITFNYVECVEQVNSKQKIGNGSNFTDTSYIR